MVLILCLIQEDALRDPRDRVALLEERSAEELPVELRAIFDRRRTIERDRRATELMRMEATLLAARAYSLWAARRDSPSWERAPEYALELLRDVIRRIGDKTGSESREILFQAHQEVLTLESGQPRDSRRSITSRPAFESVRIRREELAASEHALRLQLAPAEKMVEEGEAATAIRAVMEVLEAVPFPDVPEPHDLTPALLRSLLDDLGAPAIDRREAAVKALIAAGDSALSAVEAAERSSDPEVRDRARCVLETLPPSRKARDHPEHHLENPRLREGPGAGGGGAGGLPGREEPAAPPASRGPLIPDGMS
jgi:hypothetical protein